MPGLAHIIHKDRCNQRLGGVEVTVEAPHVNSLFPVNNDTTQLSRALVTFQSFCRKGVGNRLFLPKKRVSHKPFINNPG